MKHVKHIKYVHPADKYIKHIPDYMAFGRKTILRINPKHIPDLHWQLTDTYHTTNIGHSTLHVCTPSVDVKTLSFPGKRRYNISGTSLHVNTTVTNSNNDTMISADTYEIQ